jgi:hypothetical protein
VEMGLELECVIMGMIWVSHIHVHMWTGVARWFAKICVSDRLSGWAQL